MKKFLTAVLYLLYLLSIKDEIFINLKGYTDFFSTFLFQIVMARKKYLSSHPHTEKENKDTKPH